MCCIKYNPEPAVFPISCDGVQPELEVDKKLIQFEKVLLHRYALYILYQYIILDQTYRKETRSLFLRNNTLLPVQWRLSGLDVLGNDFSFNQEHGIVQPKSEFELKIHFRASKANNYKRALKLEVLCAIYTEHTFSMHTAYTAHTHYTQHTYVHTHYIQHTLHRYTLHTAYTHVHTTQTCTHTIYTAYAHYTQHTTHTYTQHTQYIHNHIYLRH